MTPREVLILWHARNGAAHPAEAADSQLTNLKANGLFIGPLVATPEMKHASIQVLGFAQKWEMAVAEWMRGGGA